MTVLVFGFYIAAAGPHFLQSIARGMRPDAQRVFVTVADISAQKTGGYVVSKVILAALSALFHGIVFAAIGVPNWLPYALLVGITAQFVPLIGTYIGIILPVLATVFDTPWKALVIMVFAAIYQQIESYVFTPRVSKKTMDVNPAVALAAVFVGAADLGADRCAHRHPAGGRGLRDRRLLQQALRPDLRAVRRVGTDRVHGLTVRSRSGTSRGCSAREALPQNWGYRAEAWGGSRTTLASSRREPCRERGSRSRCGRRTPGGSVCSSPSGGTDVGRSSTAHWAPGRRRSPSRRVRSRSERGWSCWLRRPAATPSPGSRPRRAASHVRGWWCSTSIPCCTRRSCPTLVELATRLPALAAYRDLGPPGLRSAFSRLRAAGRIVELDGADLPPGAGGVPCPARAPWAPDLDERRRRAGGRRCATAGRRRCARPHSGTTRTAPGTAHLAADPGRRGRASGRGSTASKRPTYDMLLDTAILDQLQPGLVDAVCGSGGDALPASRRRAGRSGSPRARRPRGVLVRTAPAADVGAALSRGRRPGGGDSASSRGGLVPRRTGWCRPSSSTGSWPATPSGRSTASIGTRTS